MSFVCPQELIDLAHRLADEARPIAQLYFRSEKLTVENKPDQTPVTLADRQVEEMWRTIITKHRPEDGILGEEFGFDNKGAEYTWIFDPIDGTKPFCTGSTNFGMLIALHHKTEGFVLGICDQPITKDRWVGIKNQPTTLNGKAVTTRAVKHISGANFACNNPLRYVGKMRDLIQDVYQQAPLTVYGGVCLNYALLASGFVDIVIDTGQELYDLAAFIPMIEGAGGKITHLDGSPLGFDMGTYFLAASTPELHEEVLQLYKKTIV